MVAEQSPAAGADLQKLTQEERRVLRSVLAGIRQVRHGHVQVIIHDGRVVQIERLEKERLQK